MTKFSNSFEDRVKNHYLEDKGKAYHLEKRKLSEELYPWVSRLRADKFKPFIKESDDVFEYGAGNGWNLVDLNCKSKSAYDLSTLNQGVMERQGIKFYTNENEIPKEAYDVIICHHVLEHVPYPGVTLSFLSELLKPGGKLLLVVPLEGQKNSKFDQRDREGHLYSWTAQTLGNLVDRSGFEVKEISIKWRGYDRFAAEMANKLRMGEIGFRVLRMAALMIKTEREVILVGSKS